MPVVPSEMKEAVEDRAALEWAVSVGGVYVANDPFAVDLGARAGLSVDLGPVFEVGVDGTGWHDFSPPTEACVVLSRQVGIDACGVSPDVSYPESELSASIRFFPVSATLQHRWTGRLGLSVGVGVIHTLDDYNALQVRQTDPEYASTADQWLPTTSIGLLVDARHGVLGVRFRVDSVQHVEAINGGTLEMKTAFQLGAEAQLWW